MAKENPYFQQVDGKSDPIIEGVTESMLNQ